MTKPNIEANAGIYILRWEEYNLLMRLDRLRERSDAVSAEITIRSSLPGQPSHLHQARLNLTSTTARRQLANFLAERYGIIAPWGDILEQACVMVLERHREGEPAIHLGALPPREALRYRVKPLLVEKQANMLYGAGQTGKSMIAVYLSVLIESPEDRNGLIVEPGKVLYVDYETDEDEVAERVRCIQAGMEIGTPTDIIYRFGRIPLADDIEQVQRIVVENGIELVVVDSFAMACGGDQDKSLDIIRYFQALRSLKITTLTIHHINKEGKMYGNVYAYNEARCIWEAKSVAEPGTNTLNIGLYHRKMNNGRLEKPLGFKITFEEGRYTVSKQDLAKVVELEAALPLSQRLRAALSHGAASLDELSEELRKPAETLRRTMNRAKDVFVPVYIEGQREHLWGLHQKKEKDDL